MIEAWRLNLLTDREVQILEMHCQGLTTRQVADRLSLAHITVRTHQGNIYGKLGVNSLITAVANRLNHRIETGE